MGARTGTTEAGGLSVVIVTKREETIVLVIEFLELALAHLARKAHGMIQIYVVDENDHLVLAQWLFATSAWFRFFFFSGFASFENVPDLLFFEFPSPLAFFFFGLQPGHMRFQI